MTDISKVSLSKLVAMYNQFAEKPVKSFKDRAAAEKRVGALMTEQNLVIVEAQNGTGEGTGEYHLADAVDESEDFDENFDEVGAAPETQKPAKKAATKPAGGKRGPAPEYADDQKLSGWVANPKKAGTASYDRYAKYAGTKTVGAFIAAGGTRADLRWEIDHEHVKIA